MAQEMNCTTKIEEEYRNISMEIDYIFEDCEAGIQDDSLAVEPELVHQLRRRLKREIDKLSALLRKSEIKQKTKTDIIYLIDNTSNNFEEMLVIGFRRYGELPPPVEK